MGGLDVQQLDHGPAEFVGSSKHVQVSIEQSLLTF